MSSTKEVLNDLNGYTDIKNNQLQDLAEQAKSLTEDYESGSLSASEYEELLRDLAVASVIVEDAADLAAQKQLNTIINVAITIAATAAKAI